MINSQGQKTGHWNKERYVTAVSRGLHSSAFIGVSRAVRW